MTLHKGGHLEDAPKPAIDEDDGWSMESVLDSVFRGQLSVWTFGCGMEVWEKQQHDGETPTKYIPSGLSALDV